MRHSMMTKAHMQRMVGRKMERVPSSAVTTELPHQPWTTKFWTSYFLTYTSFHLELY